MIYQQMVKNPWGISVYAAASVKAAPDLVRIRFRVARTEQDATEAFTLVNDDVRAVREVLRRRGVADSAVDRSQLKLETDWRWEDNERRFKGYECSAELYASAAGVNLGRLLHIEDVDPEQINKGGYRSHGSGPDSTEEDLAPGHVGVTGAVMSGFAIEHG